MQKHWRSTNHRGKLLHISTGHGYSDQAQVSNRCNVAWFWGLGRARWRSLRRRLPDIIAAHRINIYYGILKRIYIRMIAIDKALRQTNNRVLKEDRHDMLNYSSLYFRNHSPGNPFRGAHNVANSRLTFSLINLHAHYLPVCEGDANQRWV